MGFEIGPSGPWWAPLRFLRTSVSESSRAEPRCPSCWSRDCAKAFPSARLDRLFLKLHRIPCECRRCGRRFHLFHRVEAARALEAIDSEIERLIAGR